MKEKTLWKTLGNLFALRPFRTVKVGFVKVLGNSQVEMTPWSRRALGSEQRNESCFICSFLDLLDRMLPPAFKASSFPFPTYHVYFALSSFKGLFVLYLSVLASEASRSLSGSSAPLYLGNKGIYKSREGLEVITVLRPTTAACAVLILYSSLMPTNTSMWAHATAHNEVVNEGGPLAPPVHSVSNTEPARAAWALGCFHHTVLLPSLHGQEVLPCLVEHTNTSTLAICRTWKSALLQQPAAKQVPNPLFFFLLHLNVYHCIM